MKSSIAPDLLEVSDWLHDQIDGGEEAGDHDTQVSTHIRSVDKAIEILDMNITVKCATVYGRILIYPMDSNARLFCKLTNSLTLTQAQVETIKALGFTVNVELQPATL